MADILDMQTATARPAVQYPPSEIPMSPRDWLIAGALIVAALLLLPMSWPHLEPLPKAGLARIPYELSGDYWLFDQFSRQQAARGKVLLLGDSAVWGHYVPADEALSSQLNRQLGASRFANLGVDGLHPAALAGLIEHYGAGITGRDVILHCNLLWLSSPRHDLRERKAFAFNHPRLVPQLSPWIECYDEPVDGRLAVAVGRTLPSSRLAHHLRTACFGGLDIPTWTLDHPYDNPVTAVTRRPSAGTLSDMPPGATAQTWKQRQMGELAAQWVELETSLQWASFKRTAELLRRRNNRIFVVVGPFNEYMLAGPAREAYRQRLAGIEAWLSQEGIPHCCAPALPSDEYADASHPLAAGYARLARHLLDNESFVAFASVDRGTATKVNSK